MVEEGPDRAVIAASAQRGRVDRISEAALSGAWPLEVVRVDLVRVRVSSAAVEVAVEV